MLDTFVPLVFDPRQCIVQYSSIYIQIRDAQGALSVFLCIVQGLQLIFHSRPDSNAARELDDKHEVRCPRATHGTEFMVERMLAG